MTAQAMLNLNDLRVEFLQSVAKDLALPAQGKLREESRSVHFHGNARFFVGRRGDLLRMTVPTGSSAAWRAVGKRQWLTLQPAPAGARVAYRDRLFLSPLPGLVSCSASSSHGCRPRMAEGPPILMADGSKETMCHILPPLRGLPPLAFFPMACIGLRMRTRGL